MTIPERQDLAAVIAEMRAQATTLGLKASPAAWAMEDRLTAWADRLALLLAEAPRPQVQENQEVTRVEAMGNSTDNPTASENETKEATVAPNQVSNTPYRDALAASALRIGKCPHCEAVLRSVPYCCACGPHPWYGPCDGMGPDGDCSECERFAGVTTVERSQRCG